MVTAGISRICRSILLTITIFSLSLPAYAKYNGGTGEPNNPYQIGAAGPTGNTDTIPLTWTLDPESLEFEAEGEYTRVALRNGFTPEVEPGKPSLPAVSVYVLLPSGAIVSAIQAQAPESILMEDVLVYPAQPARTTNDPPAPLTLPDPVAYSSLEKTPADVASVLGTHRWHGHTLAALRLNPIRYLASQRALYFATHIEVELSYEIPAETMRSPGRPASRSRSAVMDLVANPRDMDRFEPIGVKYPSHGLQVMNENIKATGDDTAVYLLITSEALTPSFQPLVDRRTGQGKQGMLVTTEWIYANYDGTRPDGGTDDQTKIRNCIIDQYWNHGTIWVCLAGDDTIIPLRYAYGSIVHENPTDMYYACLAGTYDEDGDGLYGEALQDNADLLPEVWIGRIPVRTADQATAYIDKLVRYETAPPEGYANTMLIGSTFDWYMSGLDRPTDYWDHDPVDEGEWERRDVYRKIIQPYWQATPLGELFNSFSSWDEYRCGDYKPTYDHMISALNNGYHHVYLSGHGNPAGGAGLDRMMVDALRNATRPSIFFVMSCSTAAIDQEEPSLSEALIRCPQGGGVAYIGASRFPEISTYPAEFLYTEIFANKRETFGEAFARSKMVFVPWSHEDGRDRGNQWVFNLHGDPATPFLGGSSGRALQMLSPKGCEVIDADNDITIRWNASGTSFQEGEMVRLDYSADGGRSWLPVPDARGHPFNGRLFVWEHPGLLAGSEYRMRVVSVADPSVSSISGRNFTVSPLRILTVRSIPDTPRFWISGTHANQTDYTFTLVPGENVSLTATTKSWGDYSLPIGGYNFTGWFDVSGKQLTRSTTLVFVADGNKTVVAHYEIAGAARDYYVNDEIAEDGFAPGDDTNDGTTPATPVRHIQQIIDRCDNIATIHVSAGIYVENIVITASDTGLTLHGAGADVAIIDGKQDGSCLKVNGAEDFTIRGFTLRNGRAQDGGAIYCANVESVVIEENTLQANTADGLGGALAAVSCGDVTLAANTFTSNTAHGNGGGANIWNAPNCSLTLSGNTFRSNVADSLGGALVVSGIVQITATQNDLFDNRAKTDGGGIYLQGVAAATISDCDISGNRADRWGGALVANSSRQVVLSANRFTENTAGSDVAAIHFTDYSEGAISGNIIAGNVTGGISGGINLWSSTATIQDNFICVNSGSLGASISVRSQSQATIRHNTIAGNMAGNVGGAVYCENSSPSISNCILWGNSPTQIPLSAAAPAVSFCDVQGGWPISLANAGNITIDPFFIDPDGPDNNPATWQDNEYHIRSDSPCRDAGDPAFVPAENETDIDGQPRIIDGRVDIGADEFHAL